MLPAPQQLGIGHALMHTVIGAADAVDELLDDHGFYSRFGFVRASELRIQAPDPRWGEHVQARRLTKCPPLTGGAFRYARPCAGL